MTKVIGPLLSLDAQGTFAKTITFGANQFGNWARRIVKRGYSRTDAQDLVRTWFKSAINTFHKKSPEEQFLWDLAMKNYEEYGAALGRNLHRWARCLFTHHVLTDLSFNWNGSPFPPELKSMLASDEIEDYEQIKSDVETLTGLVFCYGVKAYFFKYLGKVQSEYSGTVGATIAGIANNEGKAIAILEDYYKGISSYEKRKLISHELMHIIMTHHGWDYGFNPMAAENICNECAERVADGELTPVYTILGQTLSELVPNPGCS
jgi:predicted metallopeptidase